MEQQDSVRRHILDMFRHLVILTEAFEVILNPAGYHEFARLFVETLQKDPLKYPLTQNPYLRK